MIEDKIFEVFLTSEQSKFINQQLPKGYSLQFTSFPTRRSQPQSTIARPLSEQNLALGSSKVVTRQRINVNQFESDDNDTRSDSNLKRNKLKKAQEKQKQKNSKQQQAGTVEAAKKISVEELKQCIDILAQLKKSEYAAPFMNPISSYGQDQFQAKNDTLDLQKVETKLAQGVYRSKSDFSEDVNKIWQNARICSLPGSDIFIKAQEMSKLFGYLLDKPKPQQQPKANSNEIEASKKTQQGVAAQPSSVKDKQDPLKKKIKTTEPAIKPEIPLNQSQQEWVYQNVIKLEDKDMVQLCSMIQGYCQTTNESMELNLDTLPVKIARDVLDFVVSKLGISPPQPQQSEDLKETEDAQKKKKSGKADKMEIPLSISEKKQLGLNIRELPAEDLTGIWSIVQDSPQHSEVIEFDIDTLPVRKARELEAYVKDKIASKLKKQKNTKTTTNPPPPFQQQTTAPYEQQLQQPSTPSPSVNAYAKQPPAYPYSQTVGVQPQPSFQQTTQTSSLSNGGIGSLPQGGGQQFLAGQNGVSPSAMSQAQQQPNLGQMKGYSNQFVPQSGTVGAYQNQMMMPQFTSNFPIQQQMQQSALMGGYQSRPVGFGADSSSQSCAVPHQFSTQTYAGQQTPYQTFGNGMPAIYQGQIQNGSAGNSRQQPGLASAQMQYGTSVPSGINGISSYGGQPVPNYYTASQQQQQYAAQYQQMQQQTAGQQNGKYTNTFGNAQTIAKTNTMTRLHNNDQSSDEMLSQELSGA